MTEPVQFIPDIWKAKVLAILESGDGNYIDWTERATMDWQMYGLKYEAYSFISKHLRNPFLIGRLVPSMKGAKEIWEFLTPNPLRIDVPFYVKIGLKADQITIKIFSTHIDLTTELIKDTEKFLKKIRRK